MFRERRDSTNYVVCKFCLTYSAENREAVSVHRASYETSLARLDKTICAAYACQKSTIPDKRASAATRDVRETRDTDRKKVFRETRLSAPAMESRAISRDLITSRAKPLTRRLRARPRSGTFRAIQALKIAATPIRLIGRR